MGRSVTPTYRIEYSDNDTPRHGRRPFSKMICWNGKSYGRATLANLERWRSTFNTSFETGGVNQHVSDAAGFILRVGSCRIVHQATNRVVATFTAPAFEVA